MSEEYAKRREEKRLASEAKKQAQAKLTGRIDCELTNPCHKEHKLTYKCMEDNNYKEDVCNIYFENYKSCKAFWNRVESDRRRKGIEPSLPPLAERDQIKAEYFKKFSGSSS